MAKQKNGINKSEMIRQILRQNPKTPVREIASQLAAKNVKVATSMIYTIKSLERRKKRKQQVTSFSGNGNPILIVRKVKDLANEVGGVKRLKELVDILAE